MAASGAVQNLRVLISGLGIAGPVAAYWLGKAGASVTVLERSGSLRKEGQTVDIRNEGITIMKWMKIEEEVRKRTTKELGLKFVDSKNLTWAAFPQRPEGSFTSEFEIVRSELATIIYQLAQKNVKYIFGDSLESFQECDDSIKVTLKNDKSKSIKFDILIVAEGLTSRTRAKAFDEDVRAPIRSLNVWAASFSYPKGESDEDWARWYSIPNSRNILVRPDGFGRIRAMASCLDSSDSIKLVASSRTSLTDQKQYFIDRFKGTGWESDKVLEGLRVSDDLYIQEIAQTKTERWSKGRVVLVGDAAFCPSAYTGLGTTAAIAGAYILAAEIVNHPTDHQAAFAAYEKTFRPWITQIQKLQPAMIRLANPRSMWGVRCLLMSAYLVSVIQKSRLFAILSKFASRFVWIGAKKITLKLPHFKTFESDHS